MSSQRVPHSHGCSCWIVGFYRSSGKTSRRNFYPIDAKAQSQGRARSPLRAGVGCANLACGFESCFSALLRARLRLTAETLGRRELVGRAVHCAPGSVVRTWLVGLNLVFRALTGAATSRWSVGAGSTLLIPDAAGRGLPALPEIRFCRNGARPAGAQFQRRIPNRPVGRRTQKPVFG